MVQDNRVSRTLARLGGVYRDPARVNRDASSLLLSSVGTNLQPIAAVHVDDTGDAHTVLVLQGTIAIHYRGQTYQLLVDLYLVPSYPNRPPVCYVRLAPNMYLKENHRHVEPDGKVFMPYLHEWNASTHNLVEMTVALSSVFSADPPVFTRPTPPPSLGGVTLPPPPTYIPSTKVTSATTTSLPPPPSSAYTSSSTTSNLNSNNSSWKIQQDQLEALMAQEAADANAAAEAARRAEYEEQQALQQKQALQQYEKAQHAQVLATVKAKLQTYCRDQASLTQTWYKQDSLDQYKLQEQAKAVTTTVPMAVANTDMSLAQQLVWFRQKKESLERNIDVVTTKTTEIQDWLKTAANQSQQAMSSTSNTKSMDDVCVGASNLHDQMLDLAAENASLSDALYVLDRSLDAKMSSSKSVNDTADNLVTDHLRTVRKLAQRQFLVRAHLLKISATTGSNSAASRGR